MIGKSAPRCITWVHDPPGDIIRPNLMLDCKHQACSLIRLYLFAANIFQILHHKVRATRPDLFARVARANGNDYGTCRNTSLYAVRRIFKDDATRGTVAEALGREEERVRRWLARAEAWVVCCDRHFGRGDAYSRKTAMRCTRDISIRSA